MTPIQFISGGVRISARLYLPDGNAAPGELPGIAMAPGFAGTMDMGYADFARHFSRNGVAVLLFDYPCFGESEGSPRGEADPWVQVQAYRDALSVLGKVDEVNPQRLGVWGASYSGAHALVLSAIDERIKAMVAMTPFTSGYAYWEPLPPEQRQVMEEMWAKDRRQRVKGAAPALIPVVSEQPGAMAAFRGKSAWEFVQAFRDRAPVFRNQVTLRSLELQRDYEPQAYCSRMPPLPRLFLVATQDRYIPEALIRSCYAACPDPKELATMNAGHFDLYQERQLEAAALATRWFKRHL